MTALFPQIDKPVRLELKNLSMSRGENILFENLSATVNTGDILWIHGDNGIGKTTLLEGLAGLSRPDSGSVSWFESEQQMTASHLIAYQPHRSFAKANLSALEDLSFWARIHDSSDLVDEALSFVNLDSRKVVPTQSLSAGQRRRLALAKLIISRKPIWIMDEPGAAMDFNGAALIDNLISRHINRGGIAIIASHDATRSLSAHTRKLTLSAAA